MGLTRNAAEGRGRYPGACTRRVSLGLAGSAANIAAETERNTEREEAFQIYSTGMPYISNAAENSKLILSSN